MSVPIPERRREPNHKALTIRGARQFNLHNLTVKIPLGLLVAVTGVSGSGKSSLIFDILDLAARQKLNGANELPGEHDSITGWEHIDKVITIDQAHIGRIPRSNAATYSDTFTPIREAFAATPEAKKNKITRAAFLVQRPRRTLRTLRRRRHADGQNALPARCRGSLSRLSWTALQEGDSRGQVSRL